MTQSSGVLVLGVHRSGTSVTAQVLQGLGLRTPPATDLMPATSDNPTGYWESESLSVFNDLVLCSYGGSWSAIPDLPAGWAAGPESRWMRFAAARAFERVFGPEPDWLWKDPRVSVLLGLWRPVLRPAAGVLVWRDPLEVAESLRRRDGFPMEVGLAVWERTTLAVLHDAVGLPMMVGRYDALLSDPTGWTRQCADLLTSAGVTLSTSTAEAADAVDPRLRRSADTAAVRDAPGEQIRAVRRLETLLETLAGPHASFTVGSLPDPSSTTTKVMNERCSGRGRAIAAPAARTVLRSNRTGRLDGIGRTIASAAAAARSERVA